MSIASVGSVGAVSANPMASRMAGRMLQEADGDQDGALSTSEFITHLAAHGISQTEAEKAFGSIDSEGAGRVNASQITAFLEKMGPPPGAGGPRPAGLPPEGSSSAGAAGGSSAASATSRSAVDEMDLNGDGEVSAEEQLLWQLRQAREEDSQVGRDGSGGRFSVTV